MTAARYKSIPYRVLAHASHLGNPGTWPYFADRVMRHITGNRLFTLPAAETARIYGRHVYSIEDAFVALDMQSVILDPMADFPRLFETGHKRVEKFGLPFGELGIAGPADVRLLYSAAVALRARSIFETGVALGWSSLVLLKVAEETKGQVISVDLPYPFLIGGAWVGAAVPPKLRTRWILLRMADRLGIPNALRITPTFDLIHYDSDKSPEGRLWAYPKLWNALRPGGLLISDDVGDNCAWAEFCESVNAPLILVRRGRPLSGIARKPGSDPDLTSENDN